MAAVEEQARRRRAGIEALDFWRIVNQKGEAGALHNAKVWIEKKADPGNSK
jgi:hypothetical protein